MTVTWQYGIPVILALVCLGLTFFGLAIWSHVTKRREKARKALVPVRFQKIPGDSMEEPGRTLEAP